VASGKGGVGKTCLSTNLSIALSQMGYRVCLFDADTSLANVNIILNIQPKFTLEHFISEGQDMDDILVPAPGGIDIVPGATGITSLLSLSGEQQTRLLSGLRSLESSYDYLLIDTSAGVDAPLLKFIEAAPYIVLTITHEPTSLTDAFSLLKVMKSKGIIKPIHVIVNMAQNKMSALAAYKRFSDAVAKYLHLEVSSLGFVPADPLVSRAVTNQHPLLLKYHSSSAGLCIQRIAQRLVQAITQAKPAKVGFSGFFGQMMSQDRKACPPKAEQPFHPAGGRGEILNSLISQTTQEQSTQYLSDSVDAWLGQYVRFPEPIQQALCDHISSAEQSTTKVRDKPALESQSKTKETESPQDKEKAAFLAASQIAAKLPKS